jgi:aspartate-semialdehyde dehydrogenase
MSLPDLKITATAVRVPTFACHGESVNIETDRSVDPKSVQVLLRGSPGVVVYDNPDKQEYPLGVDVVGTDATYVGRIRRDESLTNGINLWIVADNLRKGAALNAVQIAEIIAHERGLH